MTGEPELVRAFVRAVERGDGAAMRARVTQACLDDPTTALSVTVAGDQRWAAVAAASRPVFSYTGRAGDLVGYQIRTRDGNHLEVVFWLDRATGKIDAIRFI